MAEMLKPCTSPPVEIEAGDILVLCSDGITAVLDSAGVGFGCHESIQSSRRWLTTVPALGTVPRRSPEILRGQGVTDDITLLVVDHPGGR
jgi:serine phosphatase RsbU (regulator of sigma subunit)